jgi:hypothetical protein
MNVYKYTSAQNALKILREVRVKVSAADQLNDPFELSPEIDPNYFTLERAVQFLRQEHEVNSWHQKEALALGFTNKKAYKRWYLKKENLHKRAELLMPNVPKNVEQARQNFANTFSTDNGFLLFCVSKTKNSVAMWSHYAKNHQGVVIEFETDKRPFCQLPRDFILEVKYSNKKARYEHVLDVERFRKSLLEIARTKSTDWEYENEVRLVFPTQVCSGGQFVKFAADAVRSVTFGCRCSPSDQIAITQELSKSIFVHVGISKASLSNKEFKLDFFEIRSAS